MILVLLSIFLLLCLIACIFCIYFSGMKIVTSYRATEDDLLVPVLPHNVVIPHQVQVRIEIAFDMGATAVKSDG